MSKKTILITGATSGIGLAAAEMIAAQGHSVIFTARNSEKAIEVKDKLISITKNDHINFLIVDFASLESVKKLAQHILNEYSGFDVLLNNAGTWEMERKESIDGIEMNFAVNHLAPFLLTNLLLPTMLQKKSARIVNTSSMAHRRDILNLDDLEFKKQPYDGIATYSQSKLCNLLFTLYMQKMIKNSTLTVNTVHPGYVKTALFDKMGQRDWTGVPDSYDGARSTVFAAISDRIEGVSGKFFYHENEEQPSPMALNEKLAHDLWEISLKYVKHLI
jgi:NAD(P)-dependent dehydrogenase (short-subunit alcohol dehydrogenase family)